MRTSVRLCSLSVTLLAVGCASSAPPEAEPPAEAVAVSVEPIIGGVAATNYPEAAIVDIDRGATGSWYACSGTLVAPRVVLTAGHCVDGHSKWDIYVHGEYRASTGAQTYDWAEAKAETVNPNHHDLGLIFLKDPILLTTYPTLAHAAVPNGTKVWNVGRIKDGAFTSSSYEASTTIRSAVPYGYPFDYISADIIQPGDSGGAVMVDGTHTLVAVNSGAGGGIQVLARVDVLSAWLDAQVAAHGGYGGDTGKGGSSSDAGAPAPPSTSSPPPAPSGACTNEVEPNNEAATATAFGSSLCGALTTGADVDWLSFTLPSGATTLTLTATKDAVFAIGNYVKGRCLVIATGRRSAQVTVAGGGAALCAQVSSPSRAAQTYTLAKK